MDEQSQNAHDQLADQNQFRMSHHVYHLLPGKGGEQEVCSSSQRRDYPPTVYWQRQRISMRQSHYSIICRIWQEKPEGHPSTGSALSYLSLYPLSNPCQSPVLSLRGAQRRGNPYPALSVSSAASSPTEGAKTRPENPNDPLASPLGGGAPAGGGEGRPLLPNST